MLHSTSWKAGPTFFCWLIIFFSLFDTIAHAGECPSVGCWRPVLALTGGIAFTTDAGKSTTLPVIDSSTYIYFANSNQSRILFGGFAGAEALLYPNFAVQTGLSYYQTHFSPSGRLLQGVDAQSSDLYHYDYDTLLRQLLIETKFLYVWHTIYHPYFSVGLGTSFNTADDYKTNVPPFLTFTPVFSNHTTNAFTYNLGLGVDADLAENWRLGVGYRFTDFGKVELGNGMIDTVPVSRKLSQSHFYVNEVIVQLTYLMNELI